MTINQDVGVAKNVRDGEIVGLHSDTFGRSCGRHAVCGRQVGVGSIVRVTRDVLLVDRDIGTQGADDGSDQAPEMVLKVVSVQGGEEKCTIGFLPRHIAMRPTQVQRFDGQFAEVIEL